MGLGVCLLRWPLHDHATFMIARAGTSNARAAAQDAASAILDQVAGMPVAAQAALLQRLMTALIKSVAAAAQGRQVLEVVQLMKPTQNTCALSIRPSRHHYD
jgi:hypothetical protein